MQNGVKPWLTFRLTQAKILVFATGQYSMSAYSYSPLLILQFMKITDEKLYQLCKTFGARALLWRQKFIGLLPEVNRRHLFERHGFGSIFEFSAKLGGVSQEQVRTVLNLGEKFEDKPLLKA